jgi:hypothetical protein
VLLIPIHRHVILAVADRTAKNEREIASQVLRHS